MTFFEEPVLNSPYLQPHRHWELDDGRPTDRILERRRPSALVTALPSASAKSARTQSRMAFDDLSTEATAFDPSPFVNDLRQELDVWRRLPNPTQWNVTPTTQRLLQHWRSIQADEAQTIRPFFCQLEAVEAAIWLAEVAPQMGRRGRRFLDWINTANNFALQPEGAEPSPATPDLMRIAFKLATGAGKTTVMAMLIAWQALNAVRTSNSRRFSRGFLIVTPGITIKRPPARPHAERRRQLLHDRGTSCRTTCCPICRQRQDRHHQLPRLQAARDVRRRQGHAPARSKATATRSRPLETEGQMIQRVMGDLMGMKDVVVINDEAHHCYRERPVDGGGEADRRRAQGGRREHARRRASGSPASRR